MEYYTAEIHPVFAADSTHIDQAYPTAAWLREHGFSGIRYTLREHHDRTFTEFVTEDVGITADERAAGDGQGDGRRFSLSPDNNGQ